MKVLDLFCGTKSVSKIFELRGHDCISIDWDSQHNPDICADIRDISPDDILNLKRWDSIDYIHASPDCTTYSIAAVSHHRNKDLSPKSESAKVADEVLNHLIFLLNELKPTYFTIENPVGMFRKTPQMKLLSRKYFHKKITYCQYGDTRMKPTDIWHNIPTLKLKSPCKNGDKCHEPAPRGSPTGTQGLKGCVERSKIPYNLCLEFCLSIERCL